jgi:adenylate cyclase
VFAVFGLPNAGPEDAANALRCADRMITALDDWNSERSLQNEPPLAIGIGLNYGPSVIGDVGSEQSLSFTVIGDTVNTASRLQALTRTLEAPLVVSDALVCTAKTASSCSRELVDQLLDRGEQLLRGRDGVVRIWTRPCPRLTSPARTGRPFGCCCLRQRFPSVLHRDVRSVTVASK